LFEELIFRRIGGAGRQKNFKSGSSPNLAGYFDPAPMLFDDAMDRRQAEAGAFAGFFGGKERFKNPRQIFRIDARSVSPPRYRQTHVCASGWVSAWEASMLTASVVMIIDPPWAWHRGIDDQIQEKLLDHAISALTKGRFSAQRHCRQYARR